MKNYLLPILAGLLIAGAVYATPVSWEANFASQFLTPLNSLISSHVGIGTSTPGGLFSIHAPSNMRLATGSPLLLIASSTASATTTLLNMSNTGSTTFWGILNVGSHDKDNNSATSTFNNGIQINSGCFLMANGTCIEAMFIPLAGSSLITGNLISSNASNLGSSGSRWANGYFSNLDTTTITVGGFASGNLTVGGDLFINGNDISLGTGSATTTISGGFGIGVGTTTPGAAFAVATSTAGLNTAMLLSNLGSGYTFWAEDEANDATPFVIDSAGNVGIGKAIPVNRLDVSGAMAIGSYAGVNAGPSNGLIISGSVGIGTASAGTRLTVQSSGAGIDSAKFTDNENSSFYIGHPSVSVAFLGVGGATQILQFGDRDAPTTWMTLKAGNVGIGTTSPSKIFSSSGGDAIISSTGTTTIYLDTTSSTQAACWQMRTNQGKTVRVFINNETAALVSEFGACE